MILTTHLKGCTVVETQFTGSIFCISCALQYFIGRICIVWMRNLPPTVSFVSVEIISSTAQVAYFGTRKKFRRIVFGLQLIDSVEVYSRVLGSTTIGCTTVTGISNRTPFSTQAESYALILKSKTDRGDQKIVNK